MQINDVRLIEIELFSHCNRKCPWCPNHFIDRKSDNIFMSSKTLLSLLSELHTAQYSNYISFSRYEEPMSQIVEFKALVEFIKQCLPKATLVTNTNGDFLTKDNLTNLSIDELTIMDYDNQGLSKCLGKLLACDCEIDKIKSHYIYAHFNDIQILYYVDWGLHGFIGDRGGSLSQYSHTIRKKACLEPEYFVGINYDGTVSPCCNIRNDIESHKNYILGDLNEMNLIEILNSPKATAFRNECAAACFNEGSPCYYCENSGGRYTREKGGIDYE